MTPRLIPAAAVLTALAVPAAASAAVPGTFYAGQPVDGPSADIQRLGELDVARDGSGAVAYVKRDGDVDHIFVSRLVGGAWQAPERIDGGLAGAGSKPAVAAGDDGRLAIAFESGGGVFSVTRPAGAQSFTTPVMIAAGGSDPAVDMSINGIAYLSFTAPGASAADVRAARLERNATEFTVLPDPLDIASHRDAGGGDGRSRVSVAADGTAIVVWGEADRVFARRIFEQRLSAAPQDMTLDGIDNQAAGRAALPEVEIEDDSSYAWAVYRQAFSDRARVIARRLVGSQFEGPVVVDGGEAGDTPRLAMNGRGDGYATSGGAVTGTAFGAVLKDDVFNAGVLLGSGNGVAPFPVPAVAASGDGVIAWQQGEPGGGRTLHAKPYDNVPDRREVTQPGGDVTLTDPAFGAVDAARGLEASSNRAGDVAIVYVQGQDADRRIVAAAFDRSPGAFRGYSTTKWRKFARPPLKWGTAFELWGALTYRVEIDGQPYGETQETQITTPAVVPDGEHRWRVVATDRRGQSTATPSRPLRVDATPPTIAFKVSGTRKRGSQVKVAALVSDATGTFAKASGVKVVRIDFGDGTAPVVARSAAHRYRRGGKFTVRVSAGDRAGNVVAVTRRVTIKK